MAFIYPLALHFTPTSLEKLPQRIDRICVAMRRNHRVPTRFRDLAGELVFDQYSRSWIDTVPFGRDYQSAGAALADGKWVRLSFGIRLATGIYEAELYTFPVQDAPEFGGIQLNVDGRAYAALYKFEPRANGKFDDDVKRDLSTACYTVVAEAEPDAFILLPEKGTLTCASLPDIIERLLFPQPGLSGKRVGLVTGIRDSLLAGDAVQKAWNLAGNEQRLYKLLSGYTVLDLLQAM